jgi:hypothetical protein
MRMKTVYSETSGPNIMKHIVKDFSDKIIKGKDWIYEQKEMCPESLKHLFHFGNTKDNPSDVHETIDHILERLEEILYVYKSKKGYRDIDIKMACSHFFDDYPKQVFLEIYYKAPNGSTKVIQFNFYPPTERFELSGRRTGFGEREPFVTTHDENKAYFLLEQRIKEIPFETKVFLGENQQRLPLRILKNSHLMLKVFLLSYSFLQSLFLFSNILFRQTRHYAT